MTMAESPTARGRLSSRELALAGSTASVNGMKHIAASRRQRQNAPRLEPEVPLGLGPAGRATAEPAQEQFIAKGLPGELSGRVSGPGCDRRRTVLLRPVKTGNRALPVQL